MVPLHESSLHNDRFVGFFSSKYLNKAKQSIMLSTETHWTEVTDDPK